MKMKAGSPKGFSLIETMVALTIGAGVLLGVYKLWINHQREALRLKGKMEARDQLALSVKKLSNDITMAGLGMQGAPAMAKGDAVGTDTLTLYANTSETSSPLTANAHAGGNSLQVQNIATFAGYSFVGISDGTSGEVFRITGRSGSSILLSGTLKNAYATDSTLVVPLERRKYFTDQATEKLVCVSPQGATVTAKHVRNFQVSFRDKNGNSTEDLREVKSVQFSLTGVFPAKEGAINSIVFSNSAIPRNLL